tara:strand:- start:105 stop:1001 length:897 start_codon:yes stop_codon:yes gene_type:complete
VKDLIDQLARDTRMPVTDIEHVIMTAPRRYKVYTIPKRSGGVRTIAHPARELKTLQRALMELAPDSLRVHEAATAYEPGSSILKNAEVHASSNWLVKFDIQSFFNSITSTAWQSYLTELNCAESYKLVSSRVFFWKRRGIRETCLSVGAPSSPFVSNRFMHSFDVAIAKYCSANGLKFTRYADDISISSVKPIDLDAVRKAIIVALPKSNLFLLNERKTRISGPGNRRSVTGLILNNEGEVSVGRSRKRVIEAMVHNYCAGSTIATIEQVKGHLAFLRMIDFDGYQRIKRRYPDSGLF